MQYLCSLFIELQYGIYWDQVLGELLIALCYLCNYSSLHVRYLSVHTNIYKTQILKKIINNTSKNRIVNEKFQTTSRQHIFIEASNSDHSLKRSNSLT